MDRISCSSCGDEIPHHLQNEAVRTPCPICGATTRTIEVTVVESVTVRDALGYRIKDSRKTGKAKIKSEGFTRYMSSQQAALVRHSRSIDRENNWYEEEVVDEETGEVIHSCKEPLKEHIGHGSAKKRKT